MKTLTFHVQRFWPPVFLFTVSIALLCHGAPAPTWEAASSLFAKGRWTEAARLHLMTECISIAQNTTSCRVTFLKRLRKA